MTGGWKSSPRRRRSPLLGRELQAHGPDRCVEARRADRGRRGARRDRPASRCDPDPRGRDRCGQACRQRPAAGTSVGRADRRPDRGSVGRRGGSAGVLRSGRNARRAANRTGRRRRRRRGSSELVVGEPGSAPTWWAVGWARLEFGHRSLAALGPAAPVRAAASRSITFAMRSPDSRRRRRAARWPSVAPRHRSAAWPADCSTATAFARALYLLGTEPSAALGAEIGVDPRRVRLLPGALLLLEAMASRLRLPLTVSRGGIREGLLLELALR